MNIREARWAQFAALLAIIMSLIGIVAWFVNSPEPLTWTAAWEALGWTLATTPALAILGALILTRRPGNMVGWLFLIGALGSANPLSLFIPASSPVRMTPGLVGLLWLDGWSWIPPIFSLFLIPLYFPTGRLPNRGWRWLPQLAIIMWAVFAFLTLFLEEVQPINENWAPLPNPIGFISVAWVNDTFMIFWFAGLLTLLGGSVFSLINRYRRAAAVERQQIKWLLAAGAQFFVIYSLTFFNVEAPDGSSWAAVNYLFLPSIMAIPVAVAVAILRYRLYDIDVIIRKTLVYAVLSGLLALVYFGIVVLLQTMFESVSGQQSPVVIVISTLLIAALFSPLRRRVQEVIDRRFFRQKYDAQQVLARFAQTARDETDMEALTAELQHVIQETIQPESVSLWLNSTHPVPQELQP